MNFSAQARPDLITKLKTNKFDLLIIGGGITGVGIALDASSRGLKTALIEKNDFAFGTSSKSTKLVHGGLRYLKQLEFSLVKEVGSERAIVHRLAPHLVVPEKMLLPLYEKRGMGYGLASLGLKIYDWLAGVKREDQRKMLTKPQTIQHEPLVKQDDIKGGAIYAEYRTDDARLTIEVAKKAHEQGAVLLNYVKALDFTYLNEMVSGVRAHDEISGEDVIVKAQVVINAAGPWVDDLREINRSKKTKHLHLTKGVHIVIPYHRLPVRQAIYFDVPDGRMIFAIPRGRITYVGTTDTDYSGEKDHVFTSRDDADYLIDAVNLTFPSARLTLADIESSWAGLRPLIHEEGKSASELSRKDEIFESETGLISMAGGKLTGYRRMAERVVDLVVDKFFKDRQLPPCSTETILLAGAGLKDVAAVNAYNNEMTKQIGAIGLKGEDGAYLVHLFGKQADMIIDRAKAKIHPDPEINFALSELWYVLHHEMIEKAEDFLVRRSGMLFFNLPRLRMIQEPILKAMAEYFSWSESRIIAERESIQRLIKKTLEFKN